MLNMHQVFNLTIEVPASAEDMFFELGFVPTEIVVENLDTRTRLEWKTGYDVPIAIAADGTRTDAAAGHLLPTTTSTTVYYNNAKTPTYQDADGTAVDKDYYLMTDGQKSLAYNLPTLVNSEDNQNSYHSKPGFHLDSASTVVANSNTLIITARR